MQHEILRRNSPTVLQKKFSTVYEIYDITLYQAIFETNDVLESFQHPSCGNDAGYIRLGCVFCVFFIEELVFPIFSVCFA